MASRVSRRWGDWRSCSPLQLYLLLGFIHLLAAQVPPPPKPFSPTPADYSVSTKCSSILDTANKQKIMEMGTVLDLIFAPMVMACEDTICTKIYKAACSPQVCPKCKYYAGPADRFQAQVENIDGENVGSSCAVKRSLLVYLISCTVKNSLANLTASYALKVYAKQLNGTTSLVNTTASVIFQAGEISIENSGPGYWPNGNDLAVGEMSVFSFPVKDKYDNVKKKTTGAASDADIQDAFGQLDERSSSYLTSFSLKYDKDSGYVNATFIPIVLGTWPLYLGQTNVGYILDSPYTIKVSTSGPISSQNCLAVWSSKTNTMMAGELGYVTIYLKDAYNNIVNVSTGWSDVKKFTLIVVNKAGIACKDCTLLTAIPGVGYEIATINVTIPGYYKMNISDGSKVVRGSPLDFYITTGTLAIKKCNFSWLNNDSSFKAGDQAVLRVLLMDSYNNIISSSTGKKTLYGFNVFSNNSFNEISYDRFNVTFDSSPGYERISFMPTTVGDFMLHVSYNDVEAPKSPFNFTVTPGSISILNCQGSWSSNRSNFAAGQEAILQVLMMDSYDNEISAFSGELKFLAYVMDITGKKISSDIQQTYDGNSTYQIMTFNTSVAGDLVLQVERDHLSIAGSPFPFHVDPGGISPSNCQGFWPYNVSTFSVGETTIFGVLYMDSYNNSINVSDALAANISATIQMENGLGNFSILNIDYQGNPSYGTINLTSFLSGSFVLQVQINEVDIVGSPFAFQMLSGGVYAENCVGAWSNGSSMFQAGIYPSFVILLKDEFNNTFISAVNDEDLLDFNVYSMTDQGVANGLNNLTSTQNKSFGYETIRFLTTYAGSFLLYVEYNGTSISGSPFNYSVISAQADSGYEGITFNNRRAGDYVLYVTANSNSIEGSPFPYSIEPGPLSSPDCHVLWLNESTYIKAGSQASAEVLFVDAYNNSVSSYINFSMYFMRDGQTFEDVSVLTRRESGNQHISFIITLPGDYSLHLVNGGSTELNGSPLNFSIIPASISPSHCKGAWIDDVNTFKLGQSGALKIFLMDSYNNIVSASAEEANALVFSAYVISKDSAKGSAITFGISLDASKIYDIVTIYPTMSGRCLLYLLINQIQIEGSPFAFTLVSGLVYVPYCLGSWQNGTNVFERGQQVMFKVILKDDLNTTLSSTTNFNFTKMSIIDLKGKATTMRPKLISVGDPDYVIVTFNTTTHINTTARGDFLLQIGSGSTQISKSPFLFSVLPGLAWRDFH